MHVQRISCIVDPVLVVQGIHKSTDCKLVVRSQSQNESYLCQWDAWLLGQNSHLSLVYILIVSHDSRSDDSKISKHYYHLLLHYQESNLVLSKRCDSSRTITLNVPYSLLKP